MRMLDGERREIRPGTYMFIPAEMRHEPSCPAGEEACMVYFRFDRALDTTWVAPPPADPNPMPASGH